MFYGTVDDEERMRLAMAKAWDEGWDDCYRQNGFQRVNPYSKPAEKPDTATCRHCGLIIVHEDPANMGRWRVLDQAKVNEVLFPFFCDGRTEDELTLHEPEEGLS